LEVLSALDAVKAAMERCSNVLVEAEKLKKLSDEVDSLFKVGDLPKVTL
jgi:hypothetical protein